MRGWTWFLVVLLVGPARTARAEEVAPITRTPLPAPTVTSGPLREVVVRVPTQPQPQPQPQAQPQAQAPAQVLPQPQAQAQPEPKPQEPKSRPTTSRMPVAERLGIGGTACLFPSGPGIDDALRTRACWKDAVDPELAAAAKQAADDAGVLRFPLSSSSSIDLGWRAPEVFASSRLATERSTGGFGGPYAGISFRLR